MILSRFAISAALIVSLTSCSTFLKKKSVMTEAEELEHHNENKDLFARLPVCEFCIPGSSMGGAQLPGKKIEATTEADTGSDASQAKQTSGDSAGGDTANGDSASVDTETKSEKRFYFVEGTSDIPLDNKIFDIPVTLNRKTMKWVKYFTGRGRSWFVRRAGVAGKYAPILSQILKEQNLPRDLIYLAMAESGFHTHARSRASAVGPWQFIKRTGQRYGLKVGHYIDERRNTVKATLAAGRYIADLYQMFGSWELAFAAYNAGEGKVKRAIRRYRTKDFWTIARGRYLRPETRNYVPKIMALALLGKNLKAFGFHEEIQFENPLEYDEIRVLPYSDLYLLAEKLEMSFEEVKAWNPQIARWQTPPQDKPYLLKVPLGKLEKFKNCCEKEEFSAVPNSQYFYPGKNTSLSRIARLKGIPLYFLKEINSDLSGNIPKGTKVLLPFRKNQTRSHPLYSDFRRRSRRGRRRAGFKRQVRLAEKYGKKIVNPSEFYTVRAGDNLWDVAKKLNVSVYTLIRSNRDRISNGLIYPGDRLVVR